MARARIGAAIQEAELVSKAPPAFHVLAKPTGAICNLECRYCFFLAKENLYPGSRFRMPDRLLKTHIRMLIEAHRGPEVTVAWQGGEPTLMGLDFFRRSIQYQQKYSRPGLRITNTIQTNGTLINDAWAAFFKENAFLVGVSIDGPRELHDCYRVDRGGAPTFDKVMRGLDHLRNYGVEWNALTAIHQANADHPLQVYRFLRDECEAEFIQFIPIVERRNEAGVPYGRTVTGRSVGAEQYGRFMIAVFEEWLRRDVGRVHVQMFDVALANWVGVPPGLCVFSPTCGTAMAMEHNGDVYSCDHFVEPQFKIGNITEQDLGEIVTAEQQLRFGRDKLDKLPQYCRDCPVRFACHGACPKDRFVAAPDGEPGLNYLCAGYKMFFKRVDGPMCAMAGLLLQNRAPAEIMRLCVSENLRLKAAFARAGRNTPCPCGSGVKFKHCHGHSEALRA
jgi:uncharacterized protein